MASTTDATTPALPSTAAAATLKDYEYATESLNRFRKICDSMKKKLPELIPLKENAEEDPERYEEELSVFSLLWMQFNSSSRNTAIATDQFKQEVQERKSAMEKHFLKLQNLLYEKNHLLQEIQRCKEFQTKQMDKIEFPGGALEFTKEPSNREAHIGRLTTELQTRKRLDEQLESLTKKKEETDVLRETREAFLALLPEKLKELVTVSQPLQDTFKLDYTNRLTRQKAAKSLPKSLYVLYCQLEAHIDAFDTESRSMHLTIVESKTLDDNVPTSPRKEFNPIVDRSDEGDTRHSRKRSKRALTLSRSPSPVTALSELSGLAGKTPGKIRRLDDDDDSNKFATCSQAILMEITVEHENKQYKLPIRFQYLPILNVMTVESEGYKDLLTNLFPDDTGVETPNLANRYQFSSGTSVFEFPKDLPGRPYYWAQWICGICEMMRGRNFRPEPSLTAVISKIKGRFLTHLSLEKQIETISQCPSLIPIHPVAHYLFEENVKTVFESWKEEKYPEKDPFRPICIPLDGENNEWERYNSRYFIATFKNEKVGIKCLLEIPADYPLQPSRFLFQPRQCTSTTLNENQFNNLLKEIEMEVNVYYEQLILKDSENWLLSHQLRKIQMCLDILVENGGNATAHGRVRRGKDRRALLLMDPVSKQHMHR